MPHQVDRSDTSSTADRVHGRLELALLYPISKPNHIGLHAHPACQGDIVTLDPRRQQQDTEIQRIRTAVQSLRECNSRRERLVEEVKSALNQSAEANRRSERAHAVTPELLRRPYR